LLNYALELCLAPPHSALLTFAHADTKFHRHIPLFLSPFYVRTENAFFWLAARIRATKLLAMLTIFSLLVGSFFFL